MTLPKVLNLTKRQKFVLATLILMVGIVLIRAGMGGGTVFLSWRIRVLMFSIVSVIVSLWALHDQDFSGVEWLTLPILPSFYAIGTALVFPLLPARLDYFLGGSLRPDTSLIMALFIKLIYLAIFVVAYYAVLLTENIFNVAAVRSIQLLRVAHSIGFLATIATGLLFYVVIASFHLSSWENFLGVFGVTVLLAFQVIWSVDLEERIGERVRNFTLLTAIVIAEVAWVLSFWPVSVPIFALFLTAILYELIGIGQYHLGERLNRSVANEFILVAVVVILLTIFTTSWGA